MVISTSTTPRMAGFGYQQQLVPPGSGPVPSYFMPPPGQRPGGRRGPGPVQQNQPPVPMIQQQMVPRGRMYRYPGGPGRNMSDVGGMPMRDGWAIPRPMSLTALATALASLSLADN